MTMKLLQFIVLCYSSSHVHMYYSKGLKYVMGQRRQVVAMAEHSGRRLLQGRDTCPLAMMIPGCISTSANIRAVYDNRAVLAGVLSCQILLRS